MDFKPSGNYTAVTNFLILGLTDDPILCIILFVLFMGIYLFTVLGNFCTIILIRLSPQLHTPMYLFLSHLAFVDVGYSTSVTPNLLVNFMVEKNIITYPGCVTQLCSLVTFGATESFLLTFMAYDRYMAICNPLLYSVKMSDQVCSLLIVTAYIGGCLNGVTYTGCLLNLFFCGPNVINHFFCDFSPLVKLSCYHVLAAEILPAIYSAIIIAIALVTIAISYLYIFFTILNMNSTEGRHKAFSTCTSHLTAVTLFYGTIIFIYVMPTSSYSTDQNKVVSIFYIVVIPMLNPMIYSLRNKEIKDALKRLVSSKRHS
ncbi:olfactory receptor 508-like [Dromiciops gliroides]|uniref:olfactory receptor 508-like n=1 Tax=Dromiciops gliroides TaxID=33562 RepID=UPI001CC8156A|nr:olfactory receptor 508-like [Dromiciops gliroides]